MLVKVPGAWEETHLVLQVMLKATITTSKQPGWVCLVMCFKEYHLYFVLRHSYYLFQAGLELPQPPCCEDYRPVLLCLGIIFVFLGLPED